MSDEIRALSGLEGKVALVTGATRGLGLAIARKLCASGCHVLVNHRGTRQDAAAALDLLAGLPGTARPLSADVGTPAGMAAVLDAVGDEFGRLDLLVHNAASWHPASALRIGARSLRADLGVALTPLITAAPALPKLMPDGGRVVAVSSSGARSAVPGYATAGIAKAALESLVRYLAAELAAGGIAVNAVSTAKIDKPGEVANPQMLEILARRTPAGRLTRPEDVADAVALLCTPEAGWIHGQVLTVDGGLSLAP